MFDNNLYLKSVNYVSLVKTIDHMFIYIKKHSKKPIHVEFNLSKDEYKAFYKRLHSVNIHEEDFSRVMVIYLRTKKRVLFDKFKQYNDVFMECLSPIMLRNETPKLELKYKSRFRFVPCGKCPACIDKQRKYWFVRIKEEADNSYNSQFITLTYDEASIPRNSLGFYTFCKRDVQLLLKSLRKYLDKYQEKEFYKMKLRYFIVGEYGSQFGRPHYHGILFNVPNNVDLYRLIYKFWNKGRVSVSPVVPARIGYIANYMYGKSDKMPDQFVDDTNKIPLLSSRKPGIGACYVNRITIDWHHEGLKNYYQDGKILYPLPRFWSEKIFDEKDKDKIGILSEIRKKEQLEKDIIYMHEYYQKYGESAPHPEEMRRREFVRNFYNRKKKHENSNKHYHGVQPIDNT